MRCNCEWGDGLSVSLHEDFQTLLEGFAVCEDFFPEEDREAGIGVVYKWTMLDVQHCYKRHCNETCRNRSLPLALKGMILQLVHDLVLTVEIGHKSRRYVREQIMSTQEIPQ